MVVFVPPVVEFIVILLFGKVFVVLGDKTYLIILILSMQGPKLIRMDPKSI